jgi:hypothetical protein
MPQSLMSARFFNFLHVGLVLQHVAHIYQQNPAIGRVFYCPKERADASRNREDGLFVRRARRQRERASDRVFLERMNDNSAFVIATFETICGLVDVQLAQRSVMLLNGKVRDEPRMYWTGFWSQGDGACFDGAYCYRNAAV